MSWRTHGKLVMELAGAVAMALLLAYRELSADGVSASEVVMLVIAVAGVVNVWASANITSFPRAKGLVSGVFVVLNLLVGFLSDSRLSGDEQMMLALQFLSTVGVLTVPATRHVVERTVTSP